MTSRISGATIHTQAKVDFGRRVEPTTTAPLGEDRADHADVATARAPEGLRCRLCDAPLSHIFVDLGPAPLAGAFLTREQLVEPETFYPLQVFVCDSCFLVQLPVYATPEAIFRDYPYFSSYSESWLDHARRYVDQMLERFDLGPDARVVEIASNDGYLLQFFKSRGFEVLGVDPARNVAAVAEERGIPTIPEFLTCDFAERLVADGGAADLLIGNNVLAHVPNVNDFVAGLRALVKPDGMITMEFPHLLRLVEETQLDTIYHEHFSYLSLFSVERLFDSHGLTLFDVEELPTHGGSLRIYASRKESARAESPRVEMLRRRELEAGVDQLEYYASFEEKAARVKRRLLDFLISARDGRQTVVGYGAAAKANTLLNYCGVKTDMIEYIVDRSAYKQGRYMPGSHIPIHEPDRVKQTKPDYLLVLPWNIKEEIYAQMAGVKDFGCRFVVPIPELAVV
jgi:SAM-dependent methyltransferase